MEGLSLQLSINMWIVVSIILGNHPLDVERWLILVQRAKASVLVGVHRVIAI